MIDFKGFRGAFQLLMTDKMTVKRVVDAEEDEYGVIKPSRTEIVYKDIKCRVSQMNQNFDNPNNEAIDNIPVLYKLKVFAPQNIKIKTGDLITITRKVDGVDTIYVDKRASDFMQYDNHIEFYIGINTEA